MKTCTWSNFFVGLKFDDHNVKKPRELFEPGMKYYSEKLKKIDVFEQIFESSLQVLSGVLFLEKCFFFQNKNNL